MSASNACIKFEFESDVGNSLEVELFNGISEEMMSFIVPVGGRKYGQIAYTSDIERIRFVVPDDYLIKIDFVAVTDGICPPLNCELGEFTCDEQCILGTLQCDRNVDCSGGIDEEGCGFSIACDFNSGDCGYQETPESSANWTAVDSFTFTYNGNQETIMEGMLVTDFKGVDQYNLKPSVVSSIMSTIEETSCLRFQYLGTAPLLNVMVVSSMNLSGQVSWNDTKANLSSHEWRPGQLTVAAGQNMVIISTARARLSSDLTLEIEENAFMAIDNVELLAGDCADLDHPSCPSNAHLACDDGSLCYTEALLCDRVNYCASGSDEAGDACASVFSFACDFEDAALCGYELMYPYNEEYWRRKAGYINQIPPFDHTFGTKSGHFLQFVNWDNDHYKVEQTTIISPIQTFSEDGCITFWYYLNSTAIQPTALSAQILVSLHYIDTATTEFIWYDYVDRPFPTWIQGGGPVRANEAVSLNVTGIVSESYYAWPGVVAFDDVEFNPGSCTVSQECNKRTFECTDSRVCIPETFVCDGKVDCVDESDEQSCLDRPNGVVELAGGDGSYGELRYYLDGKWRAVCYPSDDRAQTEFDMETTQDICLQLGFIGNSGTFQYTLLHVNKYAVQPVDLECSNGICAHTSDCSTYYPKYAGIMCSHSACFSGQRLCPGTLDQCVAKARFCDGLPDCPNNADEKECYCEADDIRCTRTKDECETTACETCSDRGMFDCMNHQCVDITTRCDGKRECSDGTDEYKCVHVDDNQVTVYYESERIPVCYDSIGRTEAEALCSASGQGLLANPGIQHGYSIIEHGLHLTSTYMSGSLSGEIMTCYPLILHCALPECGTAAYIDEAVSPLIPHGNKAMPGEWPWQGLLYYNDNWSCGCTYLGGEWVLTATHCVIDRDSSGMVVWLGTTQTDLGEHGQAIPVADYTTHPQYSSSDVTVGYDLALIKLQYAPVIDNYTRPICLGSEESWQYILEMGEDAECYITGFGADEVYFATGEIPQKPLAETKVNIVDREKCAQLYGDFGQSISHDGICVENREPYQAACYGDSGGPFVCKSKNGHFEQFGVTSYGLRYCKYFVPSVYVSVVEYRDWIESITDTKFATHYTAIDESQP